VDQDSELSRLTATSAEQTRRIAELDARLALLEQEAHQWRESAEAKHTETIRIGAHRREPEPEAEPAAKAQSRLPVVRLYEATPGALTLPSPPPGAAAKLAVVPLPEERRETASRADETLSAGARDSYRAAVRLVSERKWDGALFALSQFMEQHPRTGLVASAMYWRGEVFYALRRYDDALREFQGLLSRFPSSDKTADSLLKLGMCHLRLGDQAMAQRYFRQVREQYPKSDAARIASREGSS
jgi:tol-pal system protein YbgF